MSKLNKDNAMAPKPMSNNEQDLQTQILELRNEKERLTKTLSEREELMANMFSYLQNFVGKSKS